MNRFINFFRILPTRNTVLTGGGYSFLFGPTSAGRSVTERSAMQMTAVYGALRQHASSLRKLGSKTGTYTGTYNGVK